MIEGRICLENKCLKAGRRDEIRVSVEGGVPLHLNNVRIKNLVEGG